MGNLTVVKRNKLFLYLSVGALWLLMVVFTVRKDDAVHTPWPYYSEESSGKVDIGSGLASVLYGPLATGDTEVILQHDRGEVYSVIPASAETLSAPTVFPAGDKRVGVAFQQPNHLDTVVLFAENEAFVFENVLAIDTELDRIAFLQANLDMELDIVISSLDRLNEQRLQLRDFPPSFLQNPQIDSAGFKEQLFLLRSPFGTVTTEVPSLI